MPWRRWWTDERDPAGRWCPWRGHQHHTGVESRRTTAEFQRSLLCASTSGPLMSAEWTLGCWRERLRGVLMVGPGTSGPFCPTWPLSRAPVAPTQRRPARPPLPGRPTPRGRGTTGQGLCVLPKSPTYVEYTRTSSSSTPPWCIAPRRRRDPPGRLHPASGAGSGSRAWETGPTGILRCHDIRNSQKS